MWNYIILFVSVCSICKVIIRWHLNRPWGTFYKNLYFTPALAVIGRIGLIRSVQWESGITPRWPISIILPVTVLKTVSLTTKPGRWSHHSILDWPFLISPFLIIRRRFTLTRMECKIVKHWILNFSSLYPFLNYTLLYIHYPQ